MSHLDSKGRFLRAARGALGATVALFAACSSSDQRPLLLVNVNGLATVANPQQVVLTVTVQDQGAGSDGGAAPMPPLTTSREPKADGKYGILLPDGTSGVASASAAVLGAGGCLLAQGVGDRVVVVSPGETSGPIIITLVAAGPCGLDGAVADAWVAPFDVPVPLDGGGVDGGGGMDVEPDAPADERPRDDIGPDRIPDVPQRLDLYPDAPASDLPPAIDVALDGGIDGQAVDSAPDVSTMNVLKNCTPYTHTRTFSGGVVGDFGVRVLSFSPDGKYLVSFGEDGRAKVWDVTATGLAPTAESSGGIVMTGDRNLYGGFSPDGNYLAVGDQSGLVTVYDFPATVSFGAPVTKWTLPATALASPAPGRAYRIQFTTDSKYLVVLYDGDSSSDPNRLGVWELASLPGLLKIVTYPAKEWPYAVLAGSYPGNLWVATAEEYTGDAGTATKVAISDASLAIPSKIAVDIPGSVDAMVFTPDGNALLVGGDFGEVSLWALPNKSSIVRQEPALIPPSTSGMSVYAIALTRDRKHFAAGLSDFFTSAFVKLGAIGESWSLTKTLEYIPWSLAFSPSGLALVVGERDMGVVLYCTP